MGRSITGANTEPIVPRQFGRKRDDSSTDAPPAGGGGNVMDAIAEAARRAAALAADTQVSGSSGGGGTGGYSSSRDGHDRRGRDDDRGRDRDRDRDRDHDRDRRSDRDRDRSRERDSDRRGREPERKKKRKSRWADESTAALPATAATMPVGLTKDQRECWLLHLEVEEITSRLKTGNLGIPRDQRDRSPSPAPVYNHDGKRLNTREQRTRTKLEKKRHELVLQCKRLNPSYKPPLDYKPPDIKIMDKIPVPQEKYPHVNFIGLIIGPRGHTLKKVERETGAKIMIRGKGSVKSGKHDKHFGQPGDEEPLHCVITAQTPESLHKAVTKVKEIIRLGTECPEGQNELKRMQLRELAALNGTLREDEMVRCRNCGSSLHRHWECPEAKNFVNSSTCTLCGGAGHIAADCRMRRSGSKAAPIDKAKMDSEYMSLMAELDGKKGGAAGGDGGSAGPAYQNQAQPPAGQQPQYGAPPGSYGYPQQQQQYGYGYPQQGYGYPQQGYPQQGQQQGYPQQGQPQQGGYYQGQPPPPSY